MEFFVRKQQAPVGSMIRITAYVLCVYSFIWLVGVEDMQFRESLRTCLHQAYAVLHSLDPDDDGKIINLYYESLHKHLPSIVLPAVMMMFGATALLFVGKRKNARPGITSARRGLRRHCFCRCWLPSAWQA